MALIGKVETEIEIKAPADKFFRIFRSQMHQLPEIASDKIHKGEIHQGDWETIGSVKKWNYSLEGNSLSLKEMVEKVDEENKSITYNIVEGDVLKLYKSIKVTTQVIPKQEGGSLAKYVIDFEKLNDDVPPPNDYLELGAKLFKDIDAHLLKP